MNVVAEGREGTLGMDSSGSAAGAIARPSGAVRGLSFLCDPLPPPTTQPLTAPRRPWPVQGYVVLDRPYGLLQWVREYVDKIPERYILMSEPDHIFFLPPPLWATPTRPAAYPFFYIEPAKHTAIISRFNPRGVNIAAFAPIGNSPVMMEKHQFASIAERWFELALAIKSDAEADGTFGWVQEMYAFSIASATALDKPIEYDLHPEFMQQPPWDSSTMRVRVSAGWHREGLGAGLGAPHLRWLEKQEGPATAQEGCVWWARGGVAAWDGTCVASVTTTPCAAVPSSLPGWSHVPASFRAQGRLHTYILHFTYGCDFALDGKFMPGKVGPWHWDKRDWVRPEIRVGHGRGRRGTGRGTME